MKTVQKLAGHSTSKMTLDVYAKSGRGDESELINKLSEQTEKASVFGAKGTNRGTENQTASIAEGA